MRSHTPTYEPSGSAPECTPSSISEWEQAGRVRANGAPAHAFGRVTSCKGLCGDQTGADCKAHPRERGKSFGMTSTQRAFKLPTTMLRSPGEMYFNVTINCGQPVCHWVDACVGNSGRAGLILCRLAKCMLTAVAGEV